jgi:hypothetical protein
VWQASREPGFVWDGILLEQGGSKGGRRLERVVSWDDSEEDKQDALGLLIVSEMFCRLISSS